ncbi:MAG: hypothetical protein ACO3MG_02265 [Saprospiraceae bacterium]
MRADTNSTSKYWIGFFISLLALVAFLIILPEWFWVTLPFLFTSFVYAMRWA